MVDSIKNKALCFLLSGAISLSIPLQSHAESYSVMGAQDIFQTTISADYFVKGYAEEDESGIKYLNDRMCIRVGSSIDAEPGQYIDMELKDGTTIPCVVAGIDEGSERAVTSIVSNSFDTAISLEDMGYKSPMIGVETLEGNFRDEISMGEDIALYAQQFLGNPYVWGGASLTNGADCSGFTMSVFGHFGISIPHYAASQSCYGVSVNEGDIQPGDLVFYDSGEGIDHVAIYIGNGQIVHASNPDDGIKISQYNYREISCIRRLF